MAKPRITIEGARQNNLKGISLSLPLHELIVVTGVSGSGKSTLAFDTIYAEGQRRYVETFSAYARQFLDRMDKSHTDRIQGIPPAIAIDQTNPVRTSRSTVGTMTELNDHLKLLFARRGRLWCGGCDQPVRRDSPQQVYADLQQRIVPPAFAESAPILLIAFPVNIPPGYPVDDIKAVLEKQGYSRIHRETGSQLDVIQDRVVFSPRRKGRILESLETAMKQGRGRVRIFPADAAGADEEPWNYSRDLHCPNCDIHYQDPSPALFSFNSPLGACETCRGFGRVIGIDLDLVVPDPSLSLAAGAIKPWQTASYRECQADLERFARRNGVPLDRPWEELSERARRWVFDGDGEWEDGQWYGVQRFFHWLESKSYRMHIRVLLSKYRTYHLCPGCAGSRLKPEALRWRVGGGAGKTIQDIVQLPIAVLRDFFTQERAEAAGDTAADVLLTEIATRLTYLCDVGLGYLTLDRQSRTLSGGEVQRINLTTALGTSLINTLFVLDEPSIGLHSRDIQRLIQILHRLRDAGNTLIVVEHDPELIQAADRIVDLGPGPGAQGGNILYAGTLAGLRRSRKSITAAYLTGRKQVTEWPASVGVPPPKQWLEVLGAAEHNLKDINVRIPLGCLVALTGVSGSGKSTLMHDVMYRALCRLKGQPSDPPGRHRAIQGHPSVDDVVLVDQSSIGKTARSNPASYVGALTGIRKRFAEAPLARQRGYDAGAFSFNSDRGRCPTCSGQGFEHVEMQFLSDVYLRCPDCDGRRYRPDILEVRIWPAGGGEFDRGRSIADVLDMTVDEAAALFHETTDVRAALAPLQAVGLGYLALGQPVPTLSGGEAQRLKLAGHLARRGKRSRGRRGCLFLLDEPTTGLHFADIAILLSALRSLIAAGHSVVIIEHNLDVIRSSDWIIDLGPEGGDGGGEVVYAGPTDGIRQAPRSATGIALSAYESAAHYADPPVVRERQVRPAPHSRTAPNHSIQILHAREHNLQNISLRIPRDAFTVITGISGSGKSTVAFDILFAEGQRRYLESLNAYARQFVQPASRPDVDAILGIPPTVAIEQRSSRGGRKSTVATITEIYHFLRLLFVKLGVQHCPDCRLPIEPQTSEAILADVMQRYRGQEVAVLAPLIMGRKGIYNDLAAWAAERGFRELRVDGTLTPTDPWPRLDRFKEHDIELPIGRHRVSPSAAGQCRSLLDRALDLGQGVAHLLAAGDDPTPAIYSTRRACPRCGRGFPDLDPRMFSYHSKHGWCPVCFGSGLEIPGATQEDATETSGWNRTIAAAARTCRGCRGKRLNAEALAVRLADRGIDHYTALTADDADRTLQALKFNERGAEVAREILIEMSTRLQFLKRVGLGYLSLDRAAPTLSGGEAQRIRLAAQLGSNLRGVCYILDEPTIGLHPRDNEMLLGALRALHRKGNTVVVVEHDEDTIRSAGHIIDLGPRAGKLGGRIVAEGTVRDLMRAPDSVTGRYLQTPLPHPLFSHSREPIRWSGRNPTPHLRIEGACLHNLKGITARIPLGRLVCVTGVSGSGKSTLVRDVLVRNLETRLARRGKRSRGRSEAPLVGCDDIVGDQHLHRVLEVDQTPIGKTPRSCPATYVGFWNDIRHLYANATESRIRGYDPGRFSFNVEGGRCADCLGQGTIRVEMSFLPDVETPCEACGGKRFNAETCSVLYRDGSIADVLAMTVDDATEFFRAHPRIHHGLVLLQQVGLGYLTLGQQSPTLSGGEAQRIKLIAELAKVRPSRRDLSGKPTLYVLDEPSIGLHLADVENLLRVLHQLADTGHSVVVIEHHLDIVAEADWVIDLGPEAGEGGGRIVAACPPGELTAHADVSHTARFLGPFLANRRKSAVKSGPREGRATEG